MRLLANAVVVFVALSHLGFLVLEMFFWDHPVGRKGFAMRLRPIKVSTAVFWRRGSCGVCGRGASS